MELLSIVVPVYNVKDYIDRCVESLVNQNYSDIEIILVDDGSGDGSSGLCDEWASKDSRIKVIHKANGGVSEARLDGIRSSSGKYIGFVDSDDSVDLNMFEKLMSNVSGYNADISHCGYKLIRNNDIKYFYNTGKLVVQNRRQGVCDLLQGKFIEPGLGNKVYKRELFDCIINGRVNMDSAIKNNEDLLMNYFLFKGAEKSVYEDFCPYNYFVREGSASKGSKNIHTIEDPVKASKIIFEDSCSSGENVKAAAELYAVKMINSASSLSGSEDGSVSQSIQKVRNALKLEIKNREFYKNIGIKLKLQSFCVAYFIKLYVLIHGIYKSLKGEK